MKLFLGLAFSYLEQVRGSACEYECVHGQSLAHMVVVVTVVLIDPPFQVSISPTFYQQLLRLWIPKVQKRLSSQAAFLRF